MKIVALLSLVCCIALVSLPAGAQVSVWTYHNNNHRDGLSTNETILNLTNVNSTSFGKLFTYAVDGYVYTQPLYVPNVNIQGRGLHNVVFIGTEHNTVYALDADSAGASGGVLWKTNLGPAAVTTIPGVYTNQTFGTRYNGGAFTDIEPEVGITGTPVIDTNTGTLYVDTFTGVVGGGVTNYFHTMHALNITSGTERSYSPVIVAASVAGVGMDSVGGVVSFNARQENQRPALALIGSILYVAYAGYADTDPYHGWIIGYNPTNLLVLTNYVFNTTPNSTVAEFPDNAGEGGIWMAGGGISADDSTNLYVALANGSFNVTNSSNKEYGDSFLKLTTTNGLSVADFFTPFNQQYLQDNDQDLGSGGLMVLPDQPGSVPHEIIGGGKQGIVYLINRDQFTTNNIHYDATNTIDFVLQTNLLVNGTGIFDTPAYFNSTVYFVGRSDALRALSLVNGRLSGGVTADFSRTYGFPGATPSITANGTNNAIVWMLQKATPQVLVANNATNVSQEIYASSQAGTRDQLANATKFAVPTVADGRVFAGGSNSLAVFGLLAGNISFSPAAFSVQKTNGNATITVSRLGGTNGAVQVSYATVAGGTATAGVNYSSTSGVLNWTNGEVGPKTFTVPVMDDGQVDPNETINLALSNPTNGAAVGPAATTTLTIISPPIDLWKVYYFGANANIAGTAGDSADPDLDHSPNLLEYAYASNPTNAGTNMFIGKAVSNQFRVTFPRDTTASDITYLVQASGGLLSWTNLLTFTATNGWVTNTPGATVSESATNGVPPYPTVNVTATVSTNANKSPSSQFYRLQIHR